MNEYQTLIRQLHEIAEKNRPVKIASPTDVVNYIKGKLAGESVEHMIVLYLNIRNHIIGELDLEGDVDRCIIYPRKIFRQALLLNASAMILIHNHPSGEYGPSHHDIQLTNTIQRGGDVLEIDLLDSIITGNKEGHFSFKEEHLIQPTTA